MPRFSFQDQLALMMTSAGSQRRLASFIGVTHQQVGRWLTIGQTLPSGDPSRVRVPTDPDIRAAVDAAFAIHVDAARAQARADHFPFLPDAPVFAYRGEYKDGRPGQRIYIDHAHRMSNDLRARTVIAAHGTEFYYAVSARSTVARVPYWWLAEARIESEGIRRDPRNEDGQRMLLARDRLMPSDEDDDEYQDAHDNNEKVALEKINTPLTWLNPAFPGSAWADDLERKLQTRHAVAVGDKGTELASTLIFQTNSKADKYGVSHDAERRRLYEARRKRDYRAKQKTAVAKKASGKRKRK